MQTELDNRSFSSTEVSVDPKFYCKSLSITDGTATSTVHRIPEEIVLVEPENKLVRKEQHPLQGDRADNIARTINHVEGTVQFLCEEHFIPRSYFLPGPETSRSIYKVHRIKYIKNKYTTRSFKCTSRTVPWIPKKYHRNLYRFNPPSEKYPKGILVSKFERYLRDIYWDKLKIAQDRRTYYCQQCEILTSIFDQVKSWEGNGELFYDNAKILLPRDLNPDISRIPIINYLSSQEVKYIPLVRVPKALPTTNLFSDTESAEEEYESDDEDQPSYQLKDQVAESYVVQQHREIIDKQIKESIWNYPWIPP